MAELIQTKWGKRRAEMGFSNVDKAIEALKNAGNNNKEMEEETQKDENETKEEETQKEE